MLKKLNQLVLSILITLSIANITSSVLAIEPPPPAPANVQASDGTFGNVVEVTWDGTSTSGIYYIFRGMDSGGGGPLGVVSYDLPHIYRDTTVVPGQTYFYWVKSCLFDGVTCSSLEGPDSGWANYCYALTLTVVGSGALDGNPANSEECPEGEYIENEKVTLTAAPGSGWHFTGWIGSDDDTSTSTGNEVTMPASTHEVTATFVQDEYNVTVGIVGSGVVNNTPGNPYLSGSTATLEPVAATGWIFSGWSGTNAAELSDNLNGTWTLLMDSNKDVTATFVQDEYSVTVGIVGNGVVNNTPGNPYLSGTSATLEPVPVLGWTFSGWSGANAAELADNSDGTWDLLMDGNKDVTATFVTSGSGTELLTNTSFEVNVPAEWRDGENLGLDEGPDCGAGNAHSGNCSLRFNGDGTSKRVFSLNPYSANAGDQFTLSIYRKGESVPVADAAYANLILFYTDGSKETFIMHLKPGNINVWEQKTITVTAAKNVKRYNLNIFYKKASGTLWVDDISLTRNSGGNLVPDPSFETWKPDDWMLSENFTTDDGMACGAGDAYVDSCGLTFVGDGTSKRLLMRVRHAGNAGEVLTFSVMRKGVALPTGAAYVNVILVNTDGTQSHNILWLHQGDWSTWGERTFDITAAKDYKWINVNIFYKKPTGTIWLDDISLMAP